MSATAHAALLDHALLTKEQEHELLLKATRAADRRERRRAADRLARANMRLVENICRRYSAPPGMDREDLFAAGLSGLTRAINKFDVDRGLRFSTYATAWIRQAVSRAVEDSGHTIRLPSHMHQRLAHARRAEEAHALATGAPPSATELAEALGLTPGELAFYEEVRARTATPPLALDVPLREQGAPLAELLPSPDGEPDASLPHLFDASREHAALLRDAIDGLPQDEAYIIRGRYGLGDASPKTLRQLSGELGVSAERVRQKQLKAQRTLYRRLVAAGCRTPGRA